MEDESTGTLGKPPIARKSSVPRQNLSELGGKFLTFFLAGEEYGIRIHNVREIIGMMPITRVPGTPKFIQGVINLRGKVISIVDLRLKLAMGVREPTDETCIIIVQAQDSEMGIVVDKVSEVLNIAAEDIAEAPSFGGGVHTDYILGIGKSAGRIRLLLDIDKVLATAEAAAIDSKMEKNENPSAPIV